MDHEATERLSTGSLGDVSVSENKPAAVGKERATPPKVPATPYIMSLHLSFTCIRPFATIVQHYMYYREYLAQLFETVCSDSNVHLLMIKPAS